MIIISKKCQQLHVALKITRCRVQLRGNNEMESKLDGYQPEDKLTIGLFDGNL